MIAKVLGTRRPTVADRLRRMFGWTLVLLAPSYGTCRRCHVPWKFAEPQCLFVMGSRSSSRFVMCRACFLRLHPDAPIDNNGVTPDGRYSWEVGFSA